MEAVEEPPVHFAVDDGKANAMSGGGTSDSLETDIGPKSNGVVESAEIPSLGANVPLSEVLNNECAASEASVVPDAPTMTEGASDVDGMPPTSGDISKMETTVAVENLISDSKPLDINQDVVESVEVLQPDNVTVEGQSRLDVSSNQILVNSDLPSTVTFETEIVVENNTDVSHDLSEVVVEEHQENYTLGDLSQGIELSEALRSSDTAENVENNNCTERAEVFNKEELLDILEGNDVLSSEIPEVLQNTDPNTKKILEAQIAMKQLSKLKARRKVSVERKKQTERKPRKKKDQSDSQNSSPTKENIKYEDDNTEDVTGHEEEVMETVEEKKENDSIVNVLVKDWDDDEPPELNKSQESLNESDPLLKTTENLVKAENMKASQEETLNRMSIDSPVNENQSNKSSDEGQTQRRQSRVIKKKVIFDPDNPDTFTKSKAVNKGKELNPEKEQPPPKKNKAEPMTPRPKSKSPVSKMAWKKPPPKSNCKTNKRLSEVDKLLMDEGAVNMIYQLTPEAPKGKKNMRTKAEFIKKIQSSTPDTKEMKFRERKKEKSEENEAKRILGGKQRESLSSSVKSPSVCEDFETHSADDSIIYRRHSSSSYSSTCLSPRRLSDVEGVRASQQPIESPTQAEDGSGDHTAETVFLADNVNNTTKEIINKDDCLSMKIKLNSKLSQALNKRKRESSKTDKPPKQKRVSKDKEEHIKAEKIANFKNLSVTFDQRLAEIHMRNTVTSVEALKELEQALTYIDSNKEISVTLLTSECGSLCSELNLSPILDENLQTRTNSAYEIAESVRTMLCVAERHTKLLVCGVWGACRGAALALLSRCDVAVASEGATFEFGAAIPMSGVAALVLTSSMITDLLVFGRKLSASEALECGLISRTVWAARAHEHVRDLARDIASQPAQSVLLKKQLLCLRRKGESDEFLTTLETERDLLVNYWTSVEGQELLRATFNAD